MPRLLASFICPALALCSVLSLLSTETEPYALIAASPRASPHCSKAKAHLLPQLCIGRQGEFTDPSLRGLCHLKQSYTQL